MSLFLRQVKKPKGIYLQIYDSFRDPVSRQPRNRVVRTLGYLHDLVSDEMPDPIQFYKDQIKEENERIKAEKQATSSPQISSLPPYRYFGYFPLQAIIRKLEIKELLDLFFSQRHSHFSVSDCLFQLIYSHLIHPASKFETHADVFPLLFQHESVSYDQLLSCLDMVGHDYEKIIELFTAQTQETYILDTSKTYFDCTNFYFEIDEEDQWRRKGPSKENRKDPILGMGLLLDANCIPVGMQLYPGNQSEKPVMRQVLGRLKTQNNIVGRTVTVADKGLNCARNIAEAVNHKDGYIFSKSVKQLEETERQWVLLENDYNSVLDDQRNVKFKIKSCTDVYLYKYTDENGRPHKLEVREKRVATFNPKLAKKQKVEISRLVDKAKSACYCQAKKDEIGESSKYVLFESTDENGDRTGHKVATSLNKSKIEKDMSCAGYNLLVTSELAVDEMDIYNTYHELWRIEETFRTMKSEINARPVYLQTPERIKGHFLVCYLAVLLERLFQFKVLDNKFGSHKVYKFIRGFNLISLSGSTYLNLAVASDVITELSEKYSLPLRNARLNDKQIKKILERNL